MKLYAVPKADLPRFLANHELFWLATGKVDPSADVYPLMPLTRPWDGVICCNLVLDFKGTTLNFPISRQELEKWALPAVTSR